MSDVSRALEQIAEIHEHLAKTEVYRGWRSLPVASSAVVGLAAAAWQSASAKPLDAWSFTIFWLAVGDRRAGHRLLGDRLALRDARDAERAAAVTRGRRPVPAGAGRRRAGDTGALIQVSPSLVTLLPGPVGALLRRRGVRGAAVRAARERLGRALLLAAGLLLLWRAPSVDALSPWAVGGTFGIGQLFAAAVLYWSIERPDRMRMRALDDAPIEGRDHGEKA